MAKNNVVLIGMRGCGKTSVATKLSRRTGKECLELDEILVQRVGMSIPEIVSSEGWIKFRDYESTIAFEVSRKQNKIISTGGGVVLRPENMEVLKGNGIVVYLDCTLDVLVKRVGDDPNRPPLTKENTRRKETQTLLVERESLYEKYADIIINADGPDIEQQAAEILSAIGERGL